MQKNERLATECYWVMLKSVRTFFYKKEKQEEGCPVNPVQQPDISDVFNDEYR